MKKNSDTKKTITVTLRIDKNIMDVLTEDADNDSISFNSLVNHVLDRYVKWGRFEDKTSLIHLNALVVKELFNRLSRDEVIKIGREISRDAIYNIILFMNGEVNFDILISWYKNRMRVCSSISDKKENNGTHKIIFKHDLGENWSFYHKSILESICHDILSIPIKVYTTNSTITIDTKDDSTYSSS
jgi:hypothetical protein